MLAALITLAVLAALAALARRRLSALEADKRTLAEALQAVYNRQRELETELGRQQADQAVLLQALVERGVADEDELQAIRRRVVDLPVRAAEDLEALQEAGRDHDELVLVTSVGPEDTLH